MCNIRDIWAKNWEDSLIMQQDTLLDGLSLCYLNHLTMHTANCTSSSLIGDRHGACKFRTYRIIIYHI